MRPVNCFIMWTVLCVLSVIYGGDAVVNYGRDFVTAFPENIAYYYPSSLTNVLKITALHNNTSFNVNFSGTNVDQGTLSSGQTRVVYLPSAVEEPLLNRSSKWVRVTSDNDITVFSVSKQADSVQTNVVQPVTNLGNVYQIPFLNFTDLNLMLNKYNISSQTSFSSAQMYSTFRLLIINAEGKDNTITIAIQKPSSSTTYTSFTLNPFEFIQMLANQSLVKITSSANISVLLTNPCLDTYACKCSMVVHQLRPANLLAQTFTVPPPYVSNYSRMFSTSDNSFSLKYGSPPVNGSQVLNPGSSDFLPFLQLLRNNSNITTSQPISLRILYPGSVIDLIPDSMFSACYLFHPTSNVSSVAVLIVETLQVQNLRLNNEYFTSVTWNVINGTMYSWAAANLVPLMSQIVWHPSSKFAMYIAEKMQSNVYYGGPAISINDVPDAGGCLVSPQNLFVANQSMSWQSSVQYCESQEGQLASLSWPWAQSFMVTTLTATGVSGKAWIGLRRSLLTTEWYWQNKQGYEYSNWDKGQPLNPEQGMCALVKMDPKGNFFWSSAQCCSSIKPMCYIPARYLSINNPYS